MYWLFKHALITNSCIGSLHRRKQLYGFIHGKKRVLTQRVQNGGKHDILTFVEHITVATYILGMIKNYLFIVDEPMGSFSLV